MKNKMIEVFLKSLMNNLFTNPVINKVLEVMIKIEDTDGEGFKKIFKKTYGQKDG